MLCCRHQRETFVLLTCDGSITSWWVLWLVIRLNNNRLPHFDLHHWFLEEENIVSNSTCLSGCGEMSRKIVFLYLGLLMCFQKCSYVVFLLTLLCYYFSSCCKQEGLDKWYFGLCNGQFTWVYCPVYKGRIHVETCSRLFFWILLLLVNESKLPCGLFPSCSQKESWEQLGRREGIFILIILRRSTLTATGRW